jgi:hypothetical protein
MLVPGMPRGGARLLANVNRNLKILKPAEKKAKYPYGGNMGRQMTPPRGKKKKDAQKL